jgi:hypothetical protein
MGTATGSAAGSGWSVVVRSVIAAVTLAVFGVAGTVGWVVGAPLRDDAMLDWIVLAVALDWRDFGHERAVARLQYELDRRGIGAQVADDDCRLVHHPDGRREVACSWIAQVPSPIGGRVGVPFGSRAVVDRDGRLW